MNQRQLLSCALASVAALGLTQPASAHMEAGKGKEKCYGVAKAGENSCSNLSGTHACAGEAQSDNEPGEWTLVPKGTCAKLGGMSEKQAVAAIKKAEQTPPIAK